MEIEVEITDKVRKAVEGGLRRNEQASELSRAAVCPSGADRGRSD